MSIALFTTIHLELAKYHLSTEEEKRIRKALRKPDELPKILIVTEKLLTGFDAPILYCMYLDFVCIFDKLEKALAFDSQDIAGVSMTY